MLCQRALWIAAVVLLSAAYCDGLFCYVCQFAGEQESSCLTNPTSIELRDCPAARYCTTKRMQYAEGGALYDFARLCDVSTPIVLNGTVSDSHFITHHTACNWDRCNSGDGIWRGSGGNNPSLGVPGKGFGSAAVARASVAWMMTFAMIGALAARRLG
ncbi:Uncharacterized protein GBIM_07152 [Gryllus bimaculatus]|nr:Uncharacterized protein GBIM_07152 [Gryllus bimaculatus]